DFHGLEPSASRRRDPRQDVPVARAAGEGDQTLGTPGVEADRDAAEASGAQCVGVAIEEDAVGGKGKVSDARDAAQQGKQAGPVGTGCPEGSTQMAVPSSRSSFFQTGTRCFTASMM